MGRVGLGLGDCGPWKVPEQGWPGSERMGPEALSEKHPLCTCATWSRSDPDLSSGKLAGLLHMPPP